MREEHSENWNRGLEDGGKTGRNIKFAPEQQRVIQAKHQHAGQSENQVIESVSRQQPRATDRNCDENDDCDHEPQSDE